mmetsp:Transcript_88118/g.229838  ORF Transcript_88118/g.229838 Transcript_88118/m.229838 type:complete len:97 (+) Transcript_88118:1641-1931(+)
MVTPGHGQCGKLRAAFEALECCAGGAPCQPELGRHGHVGRAPGSCCPLACANAALSELAEQHKFTTHKESRNDNSCKSLLGRRSSTSTISADAVYA